MHKINSVMMQYFHWYSPADGTLWKQLTENASELSKAGITAVWLPPAYKGVGGKNDAGYGVYDLFDLGEFDQKGSVRTKYGTRDEYLNAIKVAQEENIQVYSELDWHWWHFSAIDTNELDEDTDAIYLFEGKNFDLDVDQEKGNCGMMLFDSGLHANFAKASEKGKEYNLQEIFDKTLVKDVPELAVTIVGNHDTQPLQALESVVEDWFKPLAYAIILLRRDGYPCIFSADYYGAKYKDFGKDGEEYEIDMHSHRWIIDQFLEARQKYAYGDQYDYFDHPNCVGWSRQGDVDHQGGIAVLLSNGEDGHKNMQTLSPNTTYIDITEHITEPVETNDEGWGEFRCPAGSVSVWVPK